MPIVSIDEVGGDVEFPDSMSQADILKAIEGDILPKARQERFAKSPSMRPAMGIPEPAATPGARLQESVGTERETIPFQEARLKLGEKAFAPTLGPTPGNEPELMAKKSALYNRIREERDQAIGLAGDDPERRASIEQGFRQKAGQLGVSVLQEPTLNQALSAGIPFSQMVDEAPKDAGRLEKVARGVTRSGLGAAEFLTSPKGAAAILNPAVGATILLEMAGQVPDIGVRLKESIEKGDWEGAGQSGADALMAAMIGRHVYKEATKTKGQIASEALAKELQAQIQSPEWQQALRDANTVAVNRMAPGTMRPQEIRGAVGPQLERPLDAVINSRASFQPPDLMARPGVIQLSRRIPVPLPRRIVIDQRMIDPAIPRGTVRTEAPGGRESFAAESPRLNREKPSPEAGFVGERPADAVQVQEPNAGVLRPGQPEVGLPPVGKGDTKPKGPPGEEGSPGGSPVPKAPVPPEGGAGGGSAVLPSLEPKADWRITVQQPIVAGDRPWVSVADPKATEQSGKITLPENGPDFTQLPTGRYTYEEALKAVSKLEADALGIKFDGIGPSGLQFTDKGKTFDVPLGASRTDLAAKLASVREKFKGENVNEGNLDEAIKKAQAAAQPEPLPPAKARFESSAEDFGTVNLHRLMDRFNIDWIQAEMKGLDRKQWEAYVKSRLTDSGYSEPGAMLPDGKQGPHSGWEISSKGMEVTFRGEKKMIPWPEIFKIAEKEIPNAPGAPAKPTLKERSEQLMKERAELIATNMAKVPENATAVKLKSKDGKTATVTPSATEPGKWQLTWFLEDGTPAGHGVLPTRNDAIRSALGISGDYGPPHIPKGMEVIEAQSPTPAPVAPAAPARPSRRGTDRPPDVLDAVQDLLGTTGKLSLQEAKRLDPYFDQRPVWFKRMFRNGGTEFGRMGAEVESTHGFAGLTDAQALYDALLSARSRRAADRAGLKVEKQRMDAMARLYDERPRSSPLYPSELGKGAKFRLNNEKITAVEVTPEAIIVEGPRIGRQALDPDTLIYPDKGSFKQAKGGKWDPEGIIGKLEQLKAKPEEGAAFSLPHPEAVKRIGQAVWNTAIDVAIAAIKGGRSVAQGIAAAMDHIRKNSKETLNERELRDNIIAAIQEPRESAGPVRVQPVDRTQAKPAAVAAPPVGRPAGAPAAKDPLADVYEHFVPEKEPSRTVGEVARDVSDRARTGFSSKFRPLDRLVEDINRAYGKSLGKISGIFEALKGSAGRGEAEIYRFDRDVSNLVKGNEEHFNPYMMLRRGLDRLKQDLKDIETERARVAAEPLTIEGAGLKRELAAEKRFKANRRAVGDYTIPEMEAKLQLLQERLGPEVTAKFEKAADAYQKHMDEALRWQVESGRMSPEVYEQIKSENQFYAPFKILKYLEETAKPEGTGARIDTMADYTKAMSGISDPNFKLGDMLSAARMNLRVSKILADKNAAMKNIADLAPFDVEGQFIKRLGSEEKPPRGMEAVNVLEDGKQVRYAVAPEVAEAVQVYQGKGNDLVTAVLSGIGVTFKSGATALNLPFQVSNILADTPRAALVSRFGLKRVSDLYKYPIQMAQSVYASIMGDVVGKPNKLFLDFLDSGVAGSTIQESLTPNALRFEPSTRLTGAKALAKSVLNTIPNLAAAIEQSTKILGVKRAMEERGVKSGKELYDSFKDDITEIRRFSGSPDFGRMGKDVESLRLNLLVMFLNARIQGGIADIGRLAGRDGKWAAGRTWLRLGGTVGVATAYVYSLNHKTPELAADYAKIPDREKQNYWHIPKDTYITLDSGEKIRDYWRIPKRETAKWIGNLTESSLEFARNRNPEQAGRWFRSLLEDISPLNIQGNTGQERLESLVSSLNPVIKAPTELATGRDMFRHRDIIPEPLKNLEPKYPEQQFTDRTPFVFQKLADAIPDVTPAMFRSPLKLENLTQNLTAGMITQFLKRKDIQGREGFENWPLMQRFQAAPYTDQREFREKIADLKSDAALDFVKRSRLVDSILNERGNRPLPDLVREAIHKGGPDPLLIERMVDSYVAKVNGITPQERQILALPVAQRGQYLREQIKGMTPAEKGAAIQNWARKRILTEGVAAEMVK